MGGGCGVCCQALVQRWRDDRNALAKEAGAQLEREMVHEAGGNGKPDTACNGDGGV